jgi:hypothetical protein
MATILLEPVLDIAKDQAIKHLPGAEFATKTLDLANDAALSFGEKLPIIGPMLKKGEQLYGWTEDQVGKLLTGAKDDILKAFGDSPDKPDVTNAPTDQEEHTLNPSPGNFDVDEFLNNFNDEYEALTPEEKKEGVFGRPEEKDPNTGKIIKKEIIGAKDRLEQINHETLDKAFQSDSNSGTLFNLRNKFKQRNPDGSINMKIIDPLDVDELINEIVFEGEDKTTPQELRTILEDSGLDAINPKSADSKTINSIVKDYRGIERGTNTVDKFKENVDETFRAKNINRSKLRATFDKNFNKIKHGPTKNFLLNGPPPEIPEEFEPEEFEPEEFEPEDPEQRPRPAIPEQGPRPAIPEQGPSGGPADVSRPAIPEQGPSGGPEPVFDRVLSPDELAEPIIEDETIEDIVVPKVETVEDIKNVIQENNDKIDENIKKLRKGRITIESENNIKKEILDLIKKRFVLKNKLKTAPPSTSLELPGVEDIEVDLGDIRGFRVNEIRNMTKKQLADNVFGPEWDEASPFGSARDRAMINKMRGTIVKIDNNDPILKSDFELPSAEEIEKEREFARNPDIFDSFKQQLGRNILKKRLGTIADTGAGIGFTADEIEELNELGQKRELNQGQVEDVTDLAVEGPEEAKFIENRFGQKALELFKSIKNTVTGSDVGNLTLDEVGEVKGINTVLKLLEKDEPLKLELFSEKVPDPEVEEPLIRNIKKFPKVSEVGKALEDVGIGKVPEVGQALEDIPKVSEVGKALEDVGSQLGKQERADISDIAERLPGEMSQDVTNQFVKFFEDTNEFSRIGAERLDEAIGSLKNKSKLTFDEFKNFFDENVTDELNNGLNKIGSNLRELYNTLVNNFTKFKNSFLVANNEYINQLSETPINRFFESGDLVPDIELDNFANLPIDEFLSEEGELISSSEASEKLGVEESKLKPIWDNIKSGFEKFKDDFIKTSGTIQNQIKNLTPKELLFGVGGLALATGGIVLSLQDEKEVEKLEVNVDKALDDIGAPETLKNLTKGVLKDMRETGNKQTAQFKQTLQKFINDQAQLAGLGENAKKALQIFNQPTQSLIVQNENQDKLKKAEDAFERKKGEVGQRVSQIEKQATITKQSIDKDKEDKRIEREQKKLEEKKKEVEDETRIKKVEERVSKIPQELQNIIRPQLAGDKIKQRVEPVNVNIINRVQSPTNADHVDVLNDGVIQKNKEIDEDKEPKNEKNPLDEIIRKKQEIPKPQIAGSVRKRAEDPTKTRLLI